MYIINTTFSVDSTVYDEWMKWMKEEYFTTATKDGQLTSPKIYKVMVEEEQGPTLSVQLQAEKTAYVNAWLTSKCNALTQTMRAKFGDKVLGFTTILQEIG